MTPDAARVIATQDYGWSQLAARAGLTWPEATGWAMDRAVEAGITAWEPFLKDAEAARRVGALAAERGLAMPSAFVAGPLHGDGAGAAMERIAGIARAAAAFGCRMLMIYPEPARDGRKSDAALATQARNLEALARRIAPVALLYHAEEAEMAEDAREFEHVLANTDPALLRLCLDPDSLWRGGAGTAEALLAVTRRHLDRIDAVHLRQSQGGVWGEVIGPGDLPLQALADLLAPRAPFLVIEHAYEEATPHSLDPVEAHRRSLTYVQRVFGRGPA